MLKNNDVYTKFVLVQKSQMLQLAFNEFKKAINKIKIFNTDDKMLIKLTLDNLLAEIKTATKVVEGRNK